MSGPSLAARWMIRLVSAAVFLLVVCLGARAQSPQPARLARLTYVTGQVELSHASGGAPQPAVQNVPILEGATLSAAFDGQAELEFEDGSVVRMTPNTELSVVRLSVDGKGSLQTRLELLHGLIYMELRSSPSFQYSVDAQGDTVTPLENSTVRVDLDQAPAAIAVLDGRVRVTSVGPDGQQGPHTEVSAGQTLRRDGLGEQAASVRYQVKDGIDPDSWDQWNMDRDRAAAEAVSSRTGARNGFAGDQGYGWSDLDANGGWYNAGGQMVWQPDVAADSGGDGGIDSFDPYGYGAWSWTQGYGYVWASGYAWGWTPYRCGSWGYWGGFGWGWTPGPACGVYGFGGQGFRLNLHHVPKVYHGPHPPTGPVPARPLVLVNGGRAPEQRVEQARGPRTVNGVTVQPLQPVGAAFAGGSSGVGGALREDFPVNRSTHEPIVGVAVKHTAPAQAFAGSGRSTWRPAVTPGSDVVLRSQQSQAPRTTYVPPMPTTILGTPGGRSQAPAPIYSRPPAPMNTAPPAVPHNNPPPMAAPHSSAPPPAPRMSAPSAPAPAAAAPRGK